MTVTTDIKKKIGLNTPILSTFTLNWELTLYAILFVLAVVSRLYDVGARVMSHDESLHALFSWNLYAGKGYAHDPMMHGPFLFHITALMYFLFGDNDFTARLAPALFGVVLVMLPYWFRPWLGRRGALAASFMILISPGLLYYSRYIRNESYMLVWTALMVLAFFQYMRTRANRWLFIGAAVVSLMICTKEVAYIQGFIGFTFIGWALVWENLSISNRRRTNVAMIGVLVLLVVAIIILSNRASVLPPSGGRDNGFDNWEPVRLLVMLTGLLLGALLIQTGVDRQSRSVTSAIKSLREKLPVLIQALVVAVVIFVLLYTTFFSNIYGLWSGSFGAIDYWLSQQEVQRGSQPWYYYLFLVPMYEFLPVLVGLVGGLVYLFRSRCCPAHTDIQPGQESQTSPTTGAVWPSDGGLFGAFAIYWMLLTFVIYSWAGEKMPWLTVYMTQASIFLAAHVFQTVLGHFNWSVAWQRGGLILGGVLLLLIPALAALFSADPFRGQSVQAIQGTLQFMLAAVILIGLGAAIWWYARQMGSALFWRVSFVTVLLVLTLLTIRFSWMFSYINYDYVNEMMVYAHAAPDVKLALQEIDDLSRRTVGDKMIKIAYDNDSTWPLEWYMREYPNRAYYGDSPNREALDAPVVIVGSANEDKVKPFLGDRYIRQRFRLVWWPIEDYKNQTLEKLWQNYVVGPPPANPSADTAADQAARRETVRQNWKNLWDIFFYRYFADYKLSEWPYVHRFFLYIRKDTLDNIWEYQSGPVQAAGLDPYQGKRAQTDAVQIWGSNGTGDGQFVTPRNVAVGPDGRIYVADSGNHRLQVFDKDGNFLLKWGSQGAGPGQFNEPWGLAVAKDSTVYVADTWNHRIEVFSAQGEFLRSFGSFMNVQDPKADPGKFWGPRDIAIDPQGNLYVTDTGNKRVQKFTPTGEFLGVWGGGGITPGAFEEPVGIDIDQQGNIYVADAWNQRIQKFDSNFTPLAQWHVTGWDTQNVFNKPYLAVDAQGRVFISDPEGYRVIGYDPGGNIIVVWGQYGQDRSSFGLPTGLAFDAEGYLLVADADNNRIMKFKVPTPQPAAPVK